MKSLIFCKEASFKDNLVRRQSSVKSLEEARSLVECSDSQTNQLADGPSIIQNAPVDFIIEKDLKDQFNTLVGWKVVDKGVDNPIFPQGMKNTKRLIQPLPLFFSQRKSNSLSEKGFAKSLEVKEVQVNLNETFNMKSERVSKSRSLKINSLSYGRIPNEDLAHRFSTLELRIMILGEED